MTWRPIQTAPTDGTPVLAYTEAGAPLVIYWSDQLEGHWQPLGQPWREVTPTHWAPLPEAPAARAA